MKTFITLKACFALVVFLISPALFAAPPNIVFILADDLGAHDLGCYGSTFYETPNLDRLAADGVRFTQAYAACNVCSPTRASILTGKHPARLRLTTWISGRRTDRPDRKLKEANIAMQLPLGEFTLAEALKKAGYRTAFIGKWHLGGENFFPDKQGFDLNIGGCEKGHPPSYFSPYNIPTLTDGPDGEFLTDRLTDEALRFIDESKEKPFLLYLSHYAVHTPLQAKPQLVEKYRAKAANLPKSETPEFLPEGKNMVRQVQNHPVYAAMMQSLDESVGRILARLKELKLDQNTIVFFTSDNGGLSTAEGSPTANVPLRAGKGWHYEGGVRVPLLIRWPGAISSGTMDEPVLSTDFYPTILAMTGQPLLPEQHADGLNLLPLLKGGELPERPLFWHFPHYSNQGGTPGGAVRQGDFKLIEWFEDNHIELYDLKKDPGEQNNLAEQMPDRAAALKRLLHAWRKSLDAEMPTPNPNYNPDLPVRKKAKSKTKN